MPDGRVQVVTGAASGIGAACADRLAGQGPLVVADRDGERLKAVAAELGATAVRCDVSNAASVGSSMPPESPGRGCTGKR